jgi:hypothetical protein
MQVTIIVFSNNAIGSKFSDGFDGDQRYGPYTGRRSQTDEVSGSTRTLNILHGLVVVVYAAAALRVVTMRICACKHTNT